MASSLFDLSGKVALITGAHRGIGLAIAEEMANAGAAVAICSNDAEGIALAAGRLRGSGLNALGIACDVGVDGELDRLVAETERQLGAIDILVCNAGINPHFGPTAAASDDEYDAIMRINLRSVVQLTNRVTPGMSARRDGVIILTSSLSGLRGNARIGVYSLSKAALAQHARNLAVELGEYNVRANAISPGLIRTDFATPILSNEDGLQRRLEKTPLRRVGEAREIAGAAVFLAARAGAFVTGHNLVVDGGTLISDA
ncbi:SDR family NAD(P)-dependent oxidoreductase [Rhizobium rhizogenes]|uniref:SDR family NAD(P)-dependent oxidoreductase n=1 Tax=Rhizobium rhizogenes TaxID=359 RepID=UPI001574771F|nr:glucose 1-dehydrogenase [Rhizobium rhizogenes]NTF98042.1 glucose 1-dehydrogenase [Rhizobium rhizogenes]